MQCTSFALLCCATAIDRPPALGSHICASAIAVLTLGSHHSSLYLLVVVSPPTARTHPRFTVASPTTIRFRHRTEPRWPQPGRSTRTWTQLTEHRTHLNCDALQLQRALTQTSTWTQPRLTDTTQTQCANSHTHDSLTPLTLPEDDLDETPGTTPWHHRSINDHPPPPARRRHLPAALLRVAPPNDDRPPRGASTGRLPGASVASNPRPRSDTNC